MKDAVISALPRAGHVKNDTDNKWASLFKRSAKISFTSIPSFILNKIKYIFNIFQEEPAEDSESVSTMMV